MKVFGFTKKYFIFVALLSLFLGGVVWFGVVAQIQTIISNNTLIKQKISDNTKTEERIAKLKEASSNSAEVTKAFDTVNNLWPDKEDVSKFIVQSEGLASEKQIVLDSITVAEMVVKDTKSTAKTSKDAESIDSSVSKKVTKETGIKFSFQTVAPYNQLFDFIVGMERLARFNSESQISISGAAGNELTLRLTGYIYAK